jgi:hypothetical protein
MTPIKIFYHLTDLPGWEAITTEQLDKLESSGLLDAAEAVYFNLHYKESSFDELKRKYAKYDNIRWVFRNSKKDDYEHTTYKLIKEITTSSTFNFNALYFHQKGITKLGTKYESPCADWRKLLDFWNIEKWELANRLLNNGADTVGCLLVQNATLHYQGTTRWMTRDYINTLPVLELPSTIGYQAQLDLTSKHFPYRMEVEGIMSFSNKQNAKVASMYQNYEYDGYYHTLPREEYEPHYHNLIADGY